MNKVTLVGRLGRDPETHTTENDIVISKFSVATNLNVKNKQSGEWEQTTDWHNCVLFRETKIRKGDIVAIDGRLKTRSYNDKEGVKKYVTEIIVGTCEFVHRNKTDENSGYQNSKTNTSIPEKAPPNSGEMEDDLPF